MPPITLKENRLFQGSVIALAIVLTLFLAVQAWKGMAEYSRIGLEPRPINTFTVSGYGKVSGTPTLARVNLGLYSEGKDVPTVQKANTTKVNAIVDALKQMGIAAEDLQTADYNISPKFDYSNGTQTVTGYTVSQTLAAKVRNLSQVGAVIAKAGELGANQINGVSFTIDDPSQLQQEARKKALEDANKKARELADALGVKVVGIVTFSESSGGQPMPMFADSKLGLGGGGGVPAPDVQAGSLDVESNVSLTFELR